jgi:hypothetical protein
VAVRAAVERVIAELAMVENAGAEQWAAVQSVATQRAEEKEEKAAEGAQREPRGSPDEALIRAGFDVGSCVCLVCVPAPPGVFERLRSCGSRCISPLWSMQPIPPPLEQTNTDQKRLP